MDQNEAMDLACVYLALALRSIGSAEEADAQRIGIEVISNQLTRAHPDYAGDIQDACDKLHSIVNELGNLRKVRESTAYGFARVRQECKLEPSPEVLETIKYVNGALVLLRCELSPGT